MISLLKLITTPLIADHLERRKGCGLRDGQLGCQKRRSAPSSRGRGRSPACCPWMPSQLLTMSGIFDEVEKAVTGTGLSLPTILQGGLSYPDGSRGEVAGQTPTRERRRRLAEEALPTSKRRRDLADSGSLTSKTGKLPSRTHSFGKASEWYGEFQSLDSVQGCPVWPNGNGLK